MSKSTLVWAVKRILLEPITGGKGSYNKNGRFEDALSGALVDRAFVEGRNENNNNEIYIIDEEKTDELMELREANIQKKAQDKRVQGVSTNDVLAAVISEMKSTKKDDDDDDDDSELDELIEEAEKLGIVLKGRKTIKSVKAKIKEAKQLNE